ncbi:cytochrome b [Pseudoponticoccus marisrubri]|uniref:Cytochrome b561 bacterial/Ni-hydrogenase domain-containing protein n=1 Tax=Pseudoponticoccus marisrubri TaxID=1685382 RepID=A0A0W7WG13_9RHOB|nr:cytochrome b/b6 domain-containing protein [Pseudoponticoccus marisrubri]KUF09422.1 hypothetical protein AVJ23_17420 [Pseudoponticoccus marisrubri]
MTDRPERYAPAQIALHWGILVLFALNVLIGDGMEEALRLRLDGALPAGLSARVHPPVGVVVLLLTLIRIGLRWQNGAPALPETVPPLMARASHWMHMALYALLIAIPLTGMMAWGGGLRAAGEVHEALITATLILVAGHAAAALVHHFVLKDGLLRRMSPRG